jgi:phenylacetate-CoA ligase
MSPLSLKERLIYAALTPVVRRNVTRRAAEVRGRATWDRKRMESFRLARAKEGLVHAAERVPYYRDLFRNAGFNPATLSSFDEFQRIPVLTRDQLRAAGYSLLDETADYTRLIRMSTGGTTGTPVSVFLDPDGSLERMLVNHRLYAMMGRRLGDSTLMIAGSPIDAKAWTSFREKPKNRLFGITARSSFDLTQGAVQTTLRELSSDRFEWVIAYASVFDILADAVPAGYRKPSRLRIVPCAELVSQAQRDHWRESLGAEVFEVYGSREMSSMAAEVLDHRGLVVSGDLYHVEITDGEGRALPHGSPGLITVTALRERSMPLIRYQLGDVGMLLPPQPGEAHPFQRLEITHGRVLDVICCPDGKLLPGEFFPHLMKEVHTEVQRFQVVQTEIGRLEIRIVPHAGFGEDTRRYLEERIRRQTGEQMEIAIEEVQHIEHSASGKYRPTISLVRAEAKLFRPIAP